MEKQELIEAIKRLKKEKKALIVAHYYVDEEVQAVADYVGDSYYLSKVCRERSENLIIFCGVKFMGESAKILNPEKKVIMAEEAADCPLAHMIDASQIEYVRSKYEDLAVVCYINSTAEIKANSDIVVTSSNASSIIKKLPQKHVFFIPDEQLGHFVASQFPEKHFIFNGGFCHVHISITKENLRKMMLRYPKALVLVHPECRQEVIEMAAYVGSTSGIINYVSNSTSQEFIIGTERGILYELQRKNPHKYFYLPSQSQICPDMKLITLQHVYQALQEESGEVKIEKNMAGKAKHALLKMHELGK